MQDASAGVTEKKAKKTTVTFAIDDHILNKIREEADQEGQSLNGKINFILSRYIALYQYMERQKCVLIPGKYWRAIVDDTDESKAIREYKGFVLDLAGELFERKIPLNLSNWIKYVFKGIYSNGGAIERFSAYRDTDGCLCLVFRHNHGIKWSRIISTVYSEQMKEIFGYHIDSKVLPSAVVLKIKEKDAANVLNE